MPKQHQTLATGISSCNIEGTDKLCHPLDRNTQSAFNGYSRIGLNRYRCGGYNNLQDQVFLFSGHIKFSLDPYYPTREIFSPARHNKTQTNKHHKTIEDIKCAFFTMHRRKNKKIYDESQKNGNNKKNKENKK